MVTIEDFVTMKGQVCPQVISGGEDFITNLTLRRLQVLVVSVSAEFLSSLADKVALITVDEFVAGLVPGELTGRLDLFVTNITS